MVGLKMPRVIEILDARVRRLEHGEMTALEAIDALLAEEFTLRENRRVKTALVMARLSTIKTLAGFDFSFQPSLDKNRIMALAELQVHRPRRGLALARPSPIQLPISLCLYSSSSFWRGSPDAGRRKRRACAACLTSERSRSLALITHGAPLHSCRAGKPCPSPSCASAAASACD